jgi:hypothetical protein
LKKSAIVVLAKIIAVGLFIAPIIHLMVEYGSSETQIIEVTSNSYPIIILLIISMLSMGFVAYIGSSTLAAIHDHPFGFGGIYMFGTIILGLSVLSLFWLNKLNDLINYNVIQFLEDIATYKHSVQYVIAYIVVGLVIATVAYIVVGLVIATGGFIYDKTK